MIHTTPCLSLLLSVLLLSPPALHAQQTEPVFPDLLEFANSVRSCEPATTEQPHPLMPNFTVEHSVNGINDDLCDYTQTMPGDMLMSCAFDDEMRIAYADEMEHSALTGEFSGSSSSPPEWLSACSIE